MSKELYNKASKTKILSSLPSKELGSDGDIVLSTIKGKGTYLCAKSKGQWYVANKLEELRKLEKTSIRDLSVNKLRLGDATLTKQEYNTNEAFTLDSGGDIVLDAIVGNGIGMFLKNAGTTIGTVDIHHNATYFTLYENGGASTDDYFNINVGANGSTTLGTRDEAGTDANLRMYADGDIILDAISGVHKFYLSGDTDDLCTLTVAANGATTIATADSDGVVGHLKLDVDGDLILSTYSGITKFMLQGDTDDLCTLTVAANGATTIATADSDGVVGHFTLDIDGDIELNADGGNVEIKDDTATHFKFGCDTTQFTILDDTDEADYFYIRVGAAGATTIATVENGLSSAGHLTLQPDGDLILDPVSTKVIINATDDLYFDGGGDTYITEASANALTLVAGGSPLLTVSTAIGTNNKQTVVDGAVVFLQAPAVYNASTTALDFSRAQKQFLTFGAGNITNLNLKFPLTNSGNFVLLLKQDGTGSRTITNWQAFDGDENAANGSATVKFAGGSNPTLTTDANHVDIISFYWDATTEIAYGVATLDFQF